MMPPTNIPNAFKMAPVTRRTEPRPALRAKRKVPGLAQIIWCEGCLHFDLSSGGGSSE
jgi:hypothetical protein